MFAWLSDVTAQLIASVLSAVAIGAVWWAKRRFLQPLIDLHVHLGPLVADVATIKKEVQTNSGSSLKDEVTKIREGLELVDARQRGLIATMARPTFETDAQFNWVMTNRALEILTGFGFSHLERRRWVARIHDDDRDEVMVEILHAITDGRAASASFRFVTESRVIALRMEATPIFSPSKPGKPENVICWSGSLTEEPIGATR